MDTCTWPADDRPYEPPSVQSKGKKSEGKEPVWDYPHIEHGSINAVTLIQRKGSLEWTSIVKDGTGKRLTQRRGPTKVFPDTRSLPMRMPRSTVFQRAEQGAHFLRTYFPDVDLPSQLIRAEIEADTRTSRRLDDFDPYAGSLINTVCSGWSTSAQKAFMVFPMGELYTELNISPLIYTKREGLVFKPSAKPHWTFETPVQQIVASSAPADNPLRNSHFAVRTLSSTIVLEVKANPTSWPSWLDAEVNELANIMRADVGDRPIVDLQLHSEAPKAILVNQYGGVYRCTFGRGKKTLQLCNAVPTIPPENLFWRLALMDDANGCLLTSDKHVKKIDFRSNGCMLDLFSITRPGEVLTCIEGPQIDRLIRVASTSELMWFDDRFPSRPLLGYKHGRQFDRSLVVQTILSPTPLAYLTSRKNGLATVYDISRSYYDQLLHVNVPPYALPSVGGYDGRHGGFAFFRHPLDLSETSISLFQLSDRGGIHRLDLDIGLSHEEVSHFPGLGFEWSTDVKELEAKAAHLRPHRGPFDTRQPSPVDLSPLYNYIYMTSDEGDERGMEAVYETLERMPYFWQESHTPIDHMLTTFDVAFRSGEEPPNATRADFLTNSVLSSTRGYRALTQGRIVVKPITRQPLWHHNIIPTLKRFLKEVSDNPHSVVESLGQYDLLPHPDRPADSLRRESEAREQLTLDLALSADVYTIQPFTTSFDSTTVTLETMSRAAEAMSLGDEPPQIQFGYLRPTSNANADSTESLSHTEQTGPLGVRLLMKEWEVGTNPHEFVYTDPYNDGEIHTGIPPRRRKNPLPFEAVDGPGGRPVLAQSQRPPLIVASRALTPPAVPTNGRRGIAFETQIQTTSIPGIVAPSIQAPLSMNDIHSSQDFMASTPVLSGPNGGRQSAGTRKPFKKRVGGF